MTRDLFGQSIQRVDRDAQFALNELKRHPDYPAIQLRAMEESESLFKSVGSQLPKPALPSQERLDCAIKSMDIWAGAYTGLITNLADQEKYLKVLAGLRLHAWKLYIGMTGIEPLPHNQAWVAIRDRIDSLAKRESKETGAATGATAGPDRYRTCAFNRSSVGPRRLRIGGGESQRFG